MLGVEREQRRNMGVAICRQAAAASVTQDLCTLLPQIAFVGFVFAALVTRQGPIEALFSHLSDPLGNNILTNVAKMPDVISYPTPAAPPPAP